MRRFLPIVLLITILSLWSVMLTQAQQAVTMPYIKESKVVVDGIVTPNEYGGNYSESDTGITIFWEHNGTYMNIALISSGTGWVGIGFGPRLVGMDGANMIMGYVDDGGNPIVVDEIGVGHVHYNDINRGGTYNIIKKAGSESAGKTIVEFVFPLNSGDSNDQVFQEGKTYGFFVAYHASNDDTTSYHTAFSFTIDLYIEPSEVPLPTENQPPSANFTHTTEGFTVKFTDLSSDNDGNIASWQWNFGDGSPASTEQNPTHTFSEMDRYFPTLTVTDNKGGTSTISERITVPSEAERFQLWSMQIILVSAVIVFLSFFSVGIAASMKRRS